MAAIAAAPTPTLTCNVCLENFTSSGGREPMEYGCGHKICKICASTLFGDMNAGQCAKAGTDACRCPTCRNPVERYWTDLTLASLMPKPAADEKAKDEPSIHQRPIFAQRHPVAPERQPDADEPDAEELVQRVLSSPEMNRRLAENRREFEKGFALLMSLAGLLIIFMVAKAVLQG